jgi:hypothetical protein
MYMNLQTKMLEAARAFRLQKDGEDITPEMERELKGMVAPPALGYPSPRAPVFTVLNENRAPNLYEDSHFVLYLNKSLPYPELYPGNETRAGFGFMHLLACPKERIYNAETLEREDMFLLEHMRVTVKRLVDNGNFKAKVYDALLEQFISVKTTDDIKYRFEEDSRAWIARTTGENMEFYFHLHPTHSVGHLHMHCVSGNMKTSDFHDYHNTPFQTVMKKLMSM